MLSLKLLYINAFGLVIRYCFRNIQELRRSASKVHVKAALCADADRADVEKTQPNAYPEQTQDQKAENLQDNSSKRFQADASSSEQSFYFG